MLCDADIGLFIFSHHGKLYDFSTKGTMEEVIERYRKEKDTGGTQPDQATEVQPLDAENEIKMLKQEIDVLQKGLRYMFGGGCGTMVLDELLMLEKHLELWIRQIRSAKMGIMLQEIELLRNKEGLLKAANKYLQDKIEENYTGMANIDIASIVNDIPSLLSTQNDSFDFY